MKNTVSALTQTLYEIASSTKFLKKTHPILALEHADDIALFDLGTGLGAGDWEGWAVCNGQTYFSTICNKNIITPDLRNNFIVGAGDEYDVDDTGGVKEVTLQISEMPTHNHDVTDGGHTHTMTDGGHTHGITQSPHTHSITDPGHAHDTTVTQAPNFHEFSKIETTVNVTTGEGNDVPDTWTNNTDGYSVSVAVDSETTGISAVNASITISNQSATTGITAQSAETGIEIQDKGGSEAHENRPPYYAVLFVMKIG